MKKHNRRYKDSVFVDLFSEDKTAKTNFLSLYNALHGTEYQSTAILKNIRLKQVLYMSFANDVSYLIDNQQPRRERRGIKPSARIKLSYLQSINRL